MNRNAVALSLLLLLTLASCGPSSNIEREAETRAEYHMHQADSLAHANLLREAALEYTLVAKLYPKTGHYPLAVRNAALLYSNPLNPSVDDSIALNLFQTYAALPISQEEKIKADVYVVMLKRITTMERGINRRIPTTDSLQTIIRRQGNELNSRGKRIQDLETELNQTRTELQRLREVDVRINRRKNTK